ncbi:hypothetical protein ABW20_dc0100600 [Dactylellina cionopaga]|nr:hypothetical protein ABW20_dc0100600 [Dactylellina cionopaga]
MPRQLFQSMFVFASIQLVTCSIVLSNRQVTRAPTRYTYTKDTLVQPTANARFQVNTLIDVVWYIPQTQANANVDESWNVTVALDGKITTELPNLYTPQTSGEHFLDFTPTESWPISDKYQVFIFYDSGAKSLVSPNFGISGGGKTSSTEEPSTTRASRTSSATSSTQTGGTTTAASTQSTSPTDGAPASTSSASSGKVISAGILGGAIGGAVVVTLILVGLILFMRKRKAKANSRSILGGGGGLDPNDGGYPGAPVEIGGGNSIQPWSYQQTNAQNNTNVNANKKYEDFREVGVIKPVGVNELPTNAYYDPVEMPAATKERTEMMGDTDWIQPPRTGQQGQTSYQR